MIINNKLFLNVYKISRNFSTSQLIKKSYDIVICGGGMVGTSLLSKLEKDPLLADKKILLLESSAENKVDIDDEARPFTNRTCALSHATVDLLKSIDAWTHIENNRFREVKMMRVWDSVTDAMLTFHSDESSDRDCVAYIVENQVILTAIQRSLTTGEIRYRAKVAEYNFDNENEVGIKLENGEELTSKLVIGADSFKSKLRESLNINTIAWDYQQAGLVASLKLSPETVDNYTAWQRFLPTGPIALLPLSNDYSNLIWSTSLDECKRLKSLTNEEFVLEVNHALWNTANKNVALATMTKTLDNVFSTLGLNGDSKQLPPKIVEVDTDSRAFFPLSLMHASQYVSRRAALVGDAAHRIHPMCGQGVNLGFGDVTTLSAVLSDAVHEGHDIGDLSHLLTYETDRQRKVVLTLAATDALAKLKGDNILFSGIRSLSLQVANVLPPVKNQLIKMASS